MSPDQLRVSFTVYPRFVSVEGDASLRGDPAIRAAIDNLAVLLNKMPRRDVVTDLDEHWSNVLRDTAHEYAVEILRLIKQGERAKVKRPEPVERDEVDDALRFLDLGAGAV